MAARFIKWMFFFFWATVSLAEATDSSGVRILNIEVEPVGLRDLVESIIPIQVGDVYEGSLIDISKRLLVATDRFEDVSVSWVDESQKFLIKVKPRLTFDAIYWQGDSIDSSDEIQRNCVPSNESRELSQERISQLTRCILQGLQGRGYLDAQVELSVTDANLVIQVKVGDAYTIDSIEWVGMTAFRPEELDRELKNHAGGVFLPMYLDADTKSVRRLYIDRKYYITEVFRPSVQVLPDTKSVRLGWRIAETQSFDIRLRGNLPEDDPIEKLESREETLPKWFIEEMVDEIESEFRQDGYLDVKVETQRESDTKNKKEMVTLTTRRGERYLLNDPEFIGTNDREAVLKTYNSISTLRSNHAFKENEIREVIQKEFVGLLSANGFLDVRLRNIEFVVDAEAHRVRPVLYLEEGDLWTIESVRIEGIPDELKKLIEVKDLKKSLPIRGYLDEAQVEKYQADLQRAIVREGYLDAKIDRIVDRSSGKLSITIAVTPGPLYRVARILIHGAVKTNYNIIRREVLIKVGEIYREERVQDSIAHILRLGIARSVDIQPMEKNPSRSEVYVLVDISEANRFRFEFGPGYGTLDGVRATFRGTYANIGGTARRLTLYSKASRQLGDSELPTNLINPKAIPFIERKISLEYFEPTFLGLPIDARLLFTHSKQDEKTFGLLRNAFTAAVDYRLSRHWIFTTGYDLEYSDPFNIQRAANNTSDQARKKRLAAVTEDVLIEYVDDSFNPRRGSRSKVTFDLYDKNFGGNASFWLTSVRETVFLPLWTIRKSKVLGFSLSLSTGFSGPYDETPEIPVEKRFVVGGEGSVRGYGEASINPADFQGGDSFFSFMTEFHFPIFGDVDLLAFYDGGNAYSSNANYRPWDLRYGAGPGIRLNTPIGPLKFGYGFIINRKTNAAGDYIEPMGHFYFGVGAL